MATRSEDFDGMENEDDLGTSSRSNYARTIVLVGRAGNGKSATCNSIIGSNVCKSMASATSVTSTTEMHSTLLEDGKYINVIDTIGLFDTNMKPKFLGKEIVKCVDLAENGIHAMLLVLSVRGRFTAEEAIALEILMGLFGPKLPKYMIVLFTGGDELHADNQTLDDYLSRGYPDLLEDVFNACNGRRLLFDNRTNDAAMKEKQRDDLFALIETVLEENGGKPYNETVLKDFQKKEMVELRHQIKEVDDSEGSPDDLLKRKKRLQKEYDEHLKEMADKVNGELKKTVERLEEELKREKETALVIVQSARADPHTTTEELHKLEKDVKKVKEKIATAKKRSCWPF